MNEMQIEMEGKALRRSDKLFVHFELLTLI